MNEENTILEQLDIALQTLIESGSWSKEDQLSVEIGGVAVTGTATHPDANPKWAKPFGTVSYQSDAFIVIKNKSKSPVIPSLPNPELKQHHSDN